MKPIFRYSLPLDTPLIPLLEGNGKALKLFERDDLPPDDGETLSVVITSLGEDYLYRTLDSLRTNAVGHIEIILIIDGEKFTDGKGIPGSAKKEGWDLADKVHIHEENKGMRVSINEGVMFARGKYLLRPDSHTSWCHGWDVLLKKLARDNPFTCIASVYHKIEPELWQLVPHNSGVCSFNSNLRAAQWPAFVIDRQIKTVDFPVLCFSGASWMMETRHHFELGGCDEKQTTWGDSGVEWSLKFWLTGGQVLFTYQVPHAHYHRNKPYAFDADKFYQQDREYFLKYWLEGSHPLQTRTLHWLLDKFKPIPGWPNGH